MDKLRGSGTTFSTSGKSWKPFPVGNPKLAKQKARLHRLKAKGLTPKGGKAEMRRMCDEATKCPPRKLPEYFA